MDAAFPRLAQTEDSIHSSQEALLSESEFQILKNELSPHLLDEMGFLVEDNKDFMIKPDTTVYPGAVPSQSKKCSPPCINEWPGPYNFELLVNSMSSSKKTWMFSYTLNKVYIDVFKTIPLQFKIDFPNEDDEFFVRALPVYTVDQHMAYPVNRCPLHLKEDENKGLTNIDHVVRCEDQCASYEYDHDSKRFSVVSSVGRPQAGSDLITIMYSFACKSSCCGGMNRRPIMIIFTLEKYKQVVGRKTLNIRVCSCPKRDKEKEEKLAYEEKMGGELLGAGKKLMEPNDQDSYKGIPPSKRRKSLFSPTRENSASMEVYTIKVYGAANYEEVLRYLIMLKTAEYTETGSQEALRIKEEYYDMWKKLEKSNGAP